MNKSFEYEGVVWVPVDDLEGLHFDDPRCKREDCRRLLKDSVMNYGEQGYDMDCSNPKCMRKYKLSKDPHLLQFEVLEAYEASFLQNEPLVKLDRKPAIHTNRVKSKDYWIETKIREENGKLTAFVYIGKNTGSQTSGEKAQFIVDIADEELRHDATDLPPGEIVSSVKVRFKNSTTVRKYDEEKV